MRGLQRLHADAEPLDVLRRRRGLGVAGEVVVVADATAQLAVIGEVLERLSESEHREIEELRAALVRVREGTYTTCSSCGDEIASKRLEALPCTSLCVACAARAE